MPGKVPKIKFVDGHEIPQIGLGTWTEHRSGEAEQAVKDSIDIGYRHFDGAYIYRNEKELGAGIRAKIDEGVIKREDVFVTSKLWCHVHRPDLVEDSLKVSLGDLGLDYVDLYLIHWPFAFKEGNDLIPSKEADGNSLFSDVDYVDTWKAMEKLVEKGLAKSIGLSNFNKKQIDRVLARAKIQPANLQIECHPYLNQSKLIDYAKSKGITVTAYCPLGGPHFAPLQKPGLDLVLENPKLVEIAKKHEKSVAQIVLRWHIERGVIVIPKSATKSRIEANFNIFDFTLGPEDMEVINSLDCNVRLVPFKYTYGHPHHPFENDEY